jgi:predicted DNA-binding transcriptional regulator AlpA
VAERALPPLRSADDAPPPQAPVPVAVAKVGTALRALTTQFTRDTDAVSLEAIPGILVELACQHDALATLERLLLGRLVAARELERRGGDRLLDLDEAAQRLRTTKDWLRRHARRLPFTVVLSPGQVRFSVQRIDQWIARRAGRDADRLD